MLNNKEVWLRLNHMTSDFDTEHPSVLTFPCIDSAVGWLSRGLDPKACQKIDGRLPLLSNDCHLQVFVTGSLHLVGNTFIVLNEQVC